MAAQNPRYEEVAKQQSQVYRLMLGRVDAVVMEQRIFDFYLANLTRARKDPARFSHTRVRSHDLFPAPEYHFAFRQPQARELFDRKLNAMRQDGRYLRILCRLWGQPLMPCPPLPAPRF